MQSHRTLVILTGHVIEWTDFDHAGVVYQNVDPVEMVHGLSDGGMNLIAIEQIAFDCENVSAARSEIGFGSREFFRITREQNNPAAFAADVPRQHEPESARSATDQGNFIAQRVLRGANETNDYPTTK